MPLLKTDAVDWKLDRTTWDIVVPLVRIRGAEAVAQRVAIRLKLIRGELFSNMGAGMPWYKGNGVDAATAILGQPFDDVKLRAEVRKIIISVEEVGSITSLTIDFNRRTRRALIRWRGITTWGDTVADELTSQVTTPT